MPKKPKSLRLGGDRHAREARRLADRRRDAKHEYRGWYKLARWQKERRIFLDANPFCVECAKEGRDAVKATDVDHIVPHRGDYEKFWAVANWQALCSMHHLEKTGRGL